MSTIEILDPAGQVQKLAALQCNPVGTLAGKRVAILDNAKPGFAKLGMLTAEKVRAHFGMASVALHRKENPSVPASPQLLDEIARTAELAFTGSAD